MNTRAVLSEEEASVYVNLAKSTLAKQRVYGGKDAIPYVKLGPRRVGYLKTSLDEWLASRLRHSTSDDAAHNAA
jgi:predicted DNA-binding transcriptional regulator AlpA